MMIITITVSIIFALSVGLILVGKKNNQADWGNQATNVLDGLIRVYCRRFHRQKGAPILLPEKQKILLAANHLSAIDPFVLITALRKPIRFMIAKEEYEKPFLNWMFKAAGCIPVDRGGRVEGAFRSALRAIDAGEIVAIFPQGGIHRIDMPRVKIKPGIIKLSQLSQCSILPIRINGIGAPGTEGLSIITRSKISLDIHQLIPPSQVNEENFRSSISEWLLGNINEIN
jgi:1-acyl-sn-glycerol-3-phosphate acyltransferase